MMPGETPNGNTTAYIHKFAATFVWVCAFAEARRSQFGLVSSALVGLEAAVAGLVAWATYHRISRRDDGMALFICSALAPSAQLNTGRFPSVWVLLLPQVLVCLVLGFFVRFQTRGDETKKTKAAGVDPLYDVELDRPLRTRY
jgi:hypothetical protein